MPSPRRSTTSEVELIRQRVPRRTVKQVELATLEWMWWWNNSRIHGEFDMRALLEVETAYYADHESGPGACRTKLPIGTRVRPIHSEQQTVFSTAAHLEVDAVGG